VSEVDESRMGASAARFELWLSRVIEIIDQRYHAPDAPGAEGDRVLGLMPGELTVVGARGAFARQLALARICRLLLQKGGDTLLVCNGSPADVQAHLLAALSGVTVQRTFFLDGKSMRDENWPSLTDAVRTLMDRPPGLCIDASSFDAIYSEMEVRPRGTWVVIDNLHLISGHDTAMRLCRDLRAAAHALGQAVIVGVGLSHWVDVRLAKTRDRRTWPTDLPDYCAGIEHIADRLLLVSEPEAGDNENAPLDALVIDAVSARGERILLHAATSLKLAEASTSDWERTVGTSKADTKHEAARRQKAESDDANRREQGQREEIFMALVNNHGSAFIEACNDTIRDTWQRLTPVWPSGPRKGQPRETPYLTLTDGKLLLFSGTGGGGRKIRTPVSSYGQYGWSHYWQHPAWVEGAVPALTAVIDRFSAPDIPGST
jgi:hypothetical protein